MGRLALQDMIEHADSIDQALSWHLSSNCFPPAGVMFDPCKEAIEAANEGDADRMIELPEGAFYRGASEAPAYALIENFRLESFLEGDEDA